LLHFFGVDLSLGLAGVSDVDDSPIIAARHHTWVEYVDAVAAIVFVGFVDLDLWETAAALSWGSTSVATAHAGWVRVASHFWAFGSSVKSVGVLQLWGNVKSSKERIEHVMHKMTLDFAGGNGAFISASVLQFALAHDVVRKNGFVLDIKSSTSFDLNCSTFVAVVENFTETVEFVLWHTFAVSVILSDVTPATVRSVLAADEHLKEISISRIVVGS